MRRLTIREFRAELPRLDEEVEIVRHAHTIGYFIPQSMVKERPSGAHGGRPEKFLTVAEIRRAFGLDR